MEENKNQSLAATAEETADAKASVVEDDEPLDKNVRLMSPTRMVLRRFFRSKLSVVGLIMIVALFLFCWVGPLVYTQWGETTQDKSGKVEYTQQPITVTVDGKEVTFYQVVETEKTINSWPSPTGTTSWAPTRTAVTCSPV